MIKNDRRTKELKRERQKYSLAHVYDCSDRVPRGKILENRVKYYKQNMSEELDESF